MTGRTTLSALLEMLADAAAMGAAKSDLMDKLQSRADAAKAFEAKAAPCLATVGAAACAAIVGAEASTDLNRAAVTAGFDTEAAGPTMEGDTSSAQTRVSLAALESLVQEGQGIGIKLDSLTDLTRLLNTARAWSQQAEFCLTGKEPQTTKHKKQHQRPSLEKVITLVHELQSMAVVLPHAEELCSKQQQAEHWVGRARQVLEQGNLGQNLPDVQALVDQGIAFGLEMPELTQLTALVKAIEWNSRVRMALRLPDELPYSQHPCGTAAQCAQQMQAYSLTSTTKSTHSHNSKWKDPKSTEGALYLQGPQWTLQLQLLPPRLLTSPQLSPHHLPSHRCLRLTMRPQPRSRQQQLH